MKLMPRHNQIFGRLVIRRGTSRIVPANEAKVNTKFLLVDAVGPNVIGIKPGDVVLHAIKNMPCVTLAGGAENYPVIDEKDVLAVAADFNLDDFVIQSKNASQFVELDDPDAAKPLGTQSRPRPNGAEASA